MGDVSDITIGTDTGGSTIRPTAFINRENRLNDIRKKI